MAFFLTTKHFPLFFCKRCDFLLFFYPKGHFLREKHTRRRIPKPYRAPGLSHTLFHTLRTKDDAKIQNSIQTHKPGTEKRLLYLIYIKKHAIDTQRQIYPPKTKLDRTISLLCLFCVVFRKCRKNFCKLVSR